MKENILKTKTSLVKASNFNIEAIPIKVVLSLLMAMMAIIISPLKLVIFFAVWMGEKLGKTLNCLTWDPCLG